MGRKRQSNTTRRSDDAYDVSTDSEVLRSFIKKSAALPSPLVTHTAPRNLRPIEDRRTYHPDGRNRPAASLDTPRHRLKLPSPNRAGSPKGSRPHGLLTHRIGFAAPQKVLICIRRKARKQVLFALGKTRKGAGSRKRRNQWSDIQC